jgi:histidyl-tRNA synthetase
MPMNRFLNEEQNSSHKGSYFYDAQSVFRADGCQADTFRSYVA